MKNVTSICCRLLVVLLSVAPMSARRVKVSVGQPGTLSRELTAKQAKGITSLTVKGTLNGDDIQYLTRLCHPDSATVAAGHGLQTLDLSRATFTPWSTFELAETFVGSPTLRHLTLGDIDYVPSAAIVDMPALETVDFKGFIGHIDGYMVSNLPRLRTIVFHDVVVSTGGSGFVANCPVLESVTFNGPVIATGFGAADECPRFKGYIVNAPVIDSDNTDDIAPSDSATLRAYKHWDRTIALQEDWTRRMIDNQENFFVAVAKMRLRPTIEMTELLGMDEATERLKALRGEVDPMSLKSKIDILKASAPYERTGQTEPRFVYAEPTDSLLSRTREFFNLDSIAGNGDEFSRIKNLLYWVHDLIPHDGSSSWPDCHFNAVDLYKVCQRDKRGLNCRFLAMFLNEVLLAEGIPARYLTCQSYDYLNDSDCHVINVAWSRSLNKWIWVDPSFAAYVTDENGLYLHPGEVRERLQKDLPLVLNEDANWNHKNKQTKEYYLEQYMAKNLYLIESCTTSQSEPEGESNHAQTPAICLTPKGFNYHGNTTTDDAYFWQAPPKELVK